MDEQPKPNSFEYNTVINLDAFMPFDWTGVPYNEAEIRAALASPMFYNKTLRGLSWWAYRTDGSVASIVNYARSLFTLDHVIVGRVKRKNKRRPRNFARNSALMDRTLAVIRYKELMRDMLLKCCLDGTCFYYVETRPAVPTTRKVLTDAEVTSTFEVNSDDPTVTVIPLPIDYCRIVCRKENSYVVAFNLAYFQQFTGTQLEAQLRAMPQEIREAYQNSPARGAGQWVVLDNTRTLVNKIRTGINQPWGEPLIIAALNDVLYADYFITTKRNLLDEVNSQIIYETFPEGAQKGTSALTSKQQDEQHRTVKAAIMNRQNSRGVTFFSLPGGSKIERLEVDTALFADTTESEVRDNVATDIGIAPSVLNGKANGNYATSTLNIELFSSYIYTFIESFVNELNKALNACVICDTSCPVDVYIMPTTFANKGKFTEQMKELYTTGKGSLTFWVASTGVDSNAYMSLMEHELLEGYEERFPVHKTSYTAPSTEDSDGGRPEVDDPDTSSTISTKANNGNDAPKPST